MNGTLNDSEMGLTPADIQELDSDMGKLESLLENASPEKDLVIEEIEDVEKNGSS